MKNQALINNLNKIAEADNTWQDDVIFYEKNKAWLDNSTKIAVKVLSTLRLNSDEDRYPNSQKDLAE